MTTVQVSIRHTLATLAYRLRRTLEGAPEGFAAITAGHGTRSAVEILAHIGDLLDWVFSLAKGAEQWNDSAPLPWAGEIVRCRKALETFDGYMASGTELKTPAEQLFQGAIADALTHVGQLAILRRIAGGPIESENYAVAPIEEGILL